MSNLLKAEDVSSYKKLAERGLMLSYPVKIKGQAVRPDLGMGYHSTVKLFDPDKDRPENIHQIANNLQLNPPDPKKTKIEPSVFKDRFGNDVHVMKLHGEHADQIKDQNKKFSSMGYPANYEYTPHVSLDKDTWQKIVDSKATTAHEAGMEFGHAEMKQGHNKLYSYHPKVQKSFQITTMSCESIRETIHLNPILKSDSKLKWLDGQDLTHYLQDNPKISELILKSYSDRVNYHFGNSPDLAEYALEHTIQSAYEKMRS